MQSFVCSMATAAAAAAAAAAAPASAPASAAAEPPPEPHWSDLGESQDMSDIDSESDDLDFGCAAAEYFESSGEAPAAAPVKKHYVRKKHILCPKCLAADPESPVRFSCVSALRLHDTRKHGQHTYKCQMPSCGRCFATQQDRARHGIIDHHDRGSPEYHRHRQHMRHGDKARHSSMVADHPDEYYQRQQKRRDAYAAKRSNGACEEPQR